MRIKNLKKNICIIIPALILIALCTQNKVCATGTKSDTASSDHVMVLIDDWGWMDVQYNCWYGETYDRQDIYNVTYNYREIHQKSFSSRRKEDIPSGLVAGISPSWVHHKGSTGSKMFIMKWTSTFFDPNAFQEQYLTNNESVTYPSSTDKVANTCYTVCGGGIGNPYSKVLKIPLSIGGRSY